MTISQVCRQCLDICTEAWHDALVVSPVDPHRARRPLMPRPFGSRLVLPPELRQRLQTLARASSTPQALAFRCRIILQLTAADSPTNQAAAQALDCDRHTVGLWRE